MTSPRFSQKHIETERLSESVFSVALNLHLLSLQPFFYTYIALTQLTQLSAMASPAQSGDIESQWDSLKDLIYQFYIIEKKTLADVRDILRKHTSSFEAP